jgi:hypothetical protein
MGLKRCECGSEYILELSKECGRHKAQKGYVWLVPAKTDNTRAAIYGCVIYICHMHIIRHVDFHIFC